MNLCPNCGHSLKVDEAITIGSWHVSPTSVTHDGLPVAVSRTQRGILYAIAKAERPISAHAIGIRVCGPNTEDPYGSILALISKIRRQLGALCPIETVWGEGYVWRADA